MTFQRPDNVALLREAFDTVKRKPPFRIEARVLLPEHLHCLWTLPDGDRHYPLRDVDQILLHVPVHGSWCGHVFSVPRAQREQTVWQRLYQEHQIRDERDFDLHCDYLHYNPVKHGLVERAADWPYSTFHRFVMAGGVPE